MESLLRDVRFAFRSLWKRPGFAAVAILTVAVGVGANSAIFSVVNAVLLRPVDVYEPDRLVVPDVISPNGFSISLAIPNFRDWRERSRTLESFAAVMGRSRTLTGGERAEIVRTRWVLGDFFETLGVPAAVGRTIPSEDTFEGAAPVAVITHGFWQRHFGGDDPLGQSLTLDDEAFTVVGVMPPSFQFPDVRSEIFLPMGYYSEQLCWNNRGCSQGSFGIGRMAPGATLASVQRDLDRIHREIEAEEGQPVAHPEFESLTDFYVGDIRRNLWLLMGAVAFVLLIACANVASLMLARGEARRKEVALRSALGAGRGRVMRQFLTESMVLAGLGGLAGLIVALLGVRALVPLVSDALPAALAARIGVDLPVLVFTGVATLAAGVVFGLAPMLRVSRTDLVGELRDGSRGATRAGGSWLRSALVVAQVALSLVLLIGAGLMVQSLGQLRTVDKGFSEEGIFTGEVTLPRARYDGREPAWAFFRDLRERVAALPGVELASLTQILPLEGNSWEQGIYPEGVAIAPENVQSVLYYMVTPDHFEVFDIPMLAGRGFEPQDRDGNVSVAVIDETMAERFWPGESALGKRVTFETRDGDGPDANERIYRTVVGVVKNVRHYELENAARITVYVPFENTEGNWTTSMKIVAKTSTNPETLADPIRAGVAALDPEVPLAELQTMRSVVNEAMSAPRALGTLLGVFAAVALALSAIGLFGLMSYTVAQRFRDIGIKMALGASAPRLVMGVSGQGLRLAALGVVAGVFGAFLLTRLMSGLLFQVDPIDVSSFVGFSVFLLLVAGAASWLPARRATRVDPAIVLRQE